MLTQDDSLSSWRPLCQGLGDISDNELRQILFKSESLMGRPLVNYQYNLPDHLLILSERYLDKSLKNTIPKFPIPLYLQHRKATYTWRSWFFYSLVLALISLVFSWWLALVILIWSVNLFFLVAILYSQRNESLTKRFSKCCSYEEIKEFVKKNWNKRSESIRD